MISICTNPFLKNDKRRIMQMKIILLLSSLLFALPLTAREVTVTGSAELYGNIGNARNQAIYNALRQAVEQGVGALIDSQTISQNFEVIKDEVLSSSRGFVTNYDILTEGQTSGGNTYEVKIRAEVSESSIKDKLSALRILHKKMGNKRVMVVYIEKDPHALPRNNGAVQTTLSSIQEELNSKGFRIFNESAMQTIYSTIEQAATIDRPTENLIALALDQRAEVVVQFEMIAGKRGKKGGMFYATKATIRFAVYDASTGRQIADVSTTGKELSTYAPGPYDWYEMLGKVGKRAGRQATIEAVDKITQFYQNIGDQGFAYLMVFRNYSVDEEDLILDYLEGTPGFNSLSELKNSPLYMEIELFSSEQKSRLRRKIRRDLRKQNIVLVAQESAGNRLVFVKPNQE